MTGRYFKSTSRLNDVLYCRWRNMPLVVARRFWFLWKKKRLRCVVAFLVRTNSKPGLHLNSTYHLVNCNSRRCRSALFAGITAGIASYIHSLCRGSAVLGLSFTSAWHWNSRQPYSVLLRSTPCAICLLSFSQTPGTIVLQAATIHSTTSVTLTWLLSHFFGASFAVGLVDVS